MTFSDELTHVSVRRCFKSLCRGCDVLYMCSYIDSQILLSARFWCYIVSVSLLTFDQNFVLLALFTNSEWHQHIVISVTANKQSKQETQLSLTNRPTHLCKCNDVAHLTSIIKIRLKKFDTSHPAFQGHPRPLKPTRIDPPSMISYQCSIATLSLRDIWDIWHKMLWPWNPG